ncbi:hypothetical protein QBC44DRAFT_570 [Cladorrhinum sp. PSN332]|nr:hypothetical protein QBC44DRAFT_570 [Cladorrhinum sp. PSN332]
MKTTLCECGKRVANAQALKQHRLDSPKHNAVSCDCGARFLTAEARNQHQRESQLHAQKDHSQKPATSAQNIPAVSAEAAEPAPEIKSPTGTTTKVSNFQCCGKRFKAEKDLLQHLESLPYHWQLFTITLAAGPRRRSNKASWPESDLNFGLCDKDCGWCGNCMRGVNV